MKGPTNNKYLVFYSNVTKVLKFLYPKQCPKSSWLNQDNDWAFHILPEAERQARTYGL